MLGTGCLGPSSEDFRSALPPEASLVICVLFPSTQDFRPPKQIIRLLHHTDNHALLCRKPISTAGSVLIFTTFGMEFHHRY